MHILLDRNPKYIGKIAFKDIVDQYLQVAEPTVGTVTVAKLHFFGGWITLPDFLTQS